MVSYGDSRGTISTISRQRIRLVAFIMHLPLVRLLRRFIKTFSFLSLFFASGNHDTRKFVALLPFDTIEVTFLIRDN